MDQSLLAPRDIAGMYFARLESGPYSWVSGISNFYLSSQAVEDYRITGMPPPAREWLGGRQYTGLSVESRLVANRHYESTIEIRKRDARRDKTPQLQARIDDFADRAESHWGGLLSALLLAGRTTKIYTAGPDSDYYEYFFATNHAYGRALSPVQSNDIAVEIGALPVLPHGTVTAPSGEEMRFAILQGIAQILGFEDEFGEPMNEFAKGFLVLVPRGLFIAASAAAGSIADPAVTVQVEDRLSWTDSFAIFRTDSPVKAFICQSGGDLSVKSKAAGSEFEFDNDAWQFGIDDWRGVGYGYWQRSCRVTMV